MHRNKQGSGFMQLQHRSRLIIAHYDIEMLTHRWRPSSSMDLRWSLVSDASVLSLGGVVEGRDAVCDCEGEEEEVSVVSAGQNTTESTNEIYTCCASTIQPVRTT